jgi:NADH:ubiquinone oxidoreductase subunit 6 (subunit J)
MGTKLAWTGLTILLASPIVGLGKIVAIVGLVVMTVGVVIMWVGKNN